MKTPEEIIGEATKSDPIYWSPNSVIEALDAAGYVIAPKEPTEEMYQAAEMEVGILQIYRAMLNAKP